MRWLEIDKSHNRAMRFAEQAIIEVNPLKKRQLYAKAYKLERKAAVMSVAGKRPISDCVGLFLSAASMAYMAGRYEVAKKLCERGLDVNPPREIQDEIQESLEQIKRGVEPLADTIAAIGAAGNKKEEEK